MGERKIGQKGTKQDRTLLIFTRKRKPKLIRSISSTCIGHSYISILRIVAFASKLVLLGQPTTTATGGQGGEAAGDSFDDQSQWTAS